MSDEPWVETIREVVRLYDAADSGPDASVAIAGLLGVTPVHATVLVSSLRRFGVPVNRHFVSPAEQGARKRANTRKKYDEAGFGRDPDHVVAERVGVTVNGVEAHRRARARAASG